SPVGGGASNAVPLLVGARFASVSAASFRGDKLARESIVAGFGVNLANGIGFGTDTNPNLPGVQLPTTLAGAKMIVRDFAGDERLSPLFFASGGQLNYQMPPGTMEGNAVVEVTNGVCPDCKISVGGAPIASIAPGVFTASSDGTGLAAAVILRVKPGNVQSFEEMVRFDTTQGKFVPVPVNLDSSTDNVFLILFGTGFRFFTMQTSVTVTIGGVTVPVSFAGAQGTLVGFDQVNAQLLPSLKNRGDVDVVLTVNGEVA